MSIVTFRNGRRVGDYHKPYIVAELNTSHFGDMQNARNMIDEAQGVGCDCVKFQSWSADTLYCKSYYKGNAIAKRIIDKFSMDNASLKELSLYCQEKGIDFASTPYSIEEAQFLVDECNVPFIKIASMELDNLPYQTQLALLGVPLVLSTGMGTSAEIAQAVSTIQATGNEQLVILHCTSVYPAPAEAIRLRNIEGLRAEFPRYPIGYSDHSQGIEIPAASVALGACLIEKHFTLDSVRIGMDNQMATEPDAMKAMVQACHRVYESLGGPERVVGEDEKAQIPKMRRSMVARVDLKPGEVLGEHQIEFKRPATGIPPTAYKSYIGRTISRPVEAGSVIQPGDFA
jgi:sialic acid synthase SpsE